MKPKKSLLSVKNLSAQVEQVQLLEDISLKLGAGEVVALIGPNGSGKTSLLKCITGELNRSSGSVDFNCRSMDSYAQPELAKLVAVLPQKSVLNFPFTAQEVVALGRSPHDSGQTRNQEIVADVLEYLDASYLSDRFYTRLSGGEQQRVQLARVLAQIWDESDRPRLLLLDEPSSYFDLAHQQLLIELVRKIASRNIAVLIVLHDVNLATACADQVAVMSCGRLVTCGEPKEVVTPEVLRSVFSVETRFLHDPVSGESFVALANQAENSGKGNGAT